MWGIPQFSLIYTQGQESPGNIKRQIKVHNFFSKEIWASCLILRTWHTSFGLTGWQSLRCLKLWQSSEKWSVFAFLLHSSAFFCLANKRSARTRQINEIGAELTFEVKICSLSTLIHSQSHEKKTCVLLVNFVISKLAEGFFQEDYIQKYVKIIHSQSKSEITLKHRLTTTESTCMWHLASKELGRCWQRHRDYLHPHRTTYMAE